MTLVISIIVLALVFDYINGFHDAANSIATVVSTRVLSPVVAVVWAAGFNFLAFKFFDLKVADTVAKTVKSEYITLGVVLTGLIAAIIWNLFTWWKGIPSSSSHTLIGGFAGAAIAHAGGNFDVVKIEKITPVLYFIVFAPLIGMLISFIISVITLHICKHINPYRVDKIFRGLQLVSSAAFSIGHGGNDAQKVMGIIAVALVAATNNPELAAQLPDYMRMEKMDIHSLPYWVPLSCYIAIAVGTLSGGWKIVKTMGQKVTKLTPFEGFAAETAGALTLFATANWGSFIAPIAGAFGVQVDAKYAVPVSTTHTITGSIIGAGIIKRISSVRWGVTINLIWAWILTIPISGALGALAYYVGAYGFGLK